MFDYYGYPNPTAEATQAATKAASSQAIPHSTLSSNPVPSFNYPHQPINLPHSNIPHYHQAHFQPNYNHYNPSLYRYRNRCVTRRVFFPLLLVGGGSYLFFKGIKKEIDVVREEVLVSRDISGAGVGATFHNDNSKSGASKIDNEGEKGRKGWRWGDHHRRERDSFIHPQQQLYPPQQDRRI